MISSNVPPSQSHNNRKRMSLAAVTTLKQRLWSFRKECADLGWSEGLRRWVQNSTQQNWPQSYVRVLHRFHRMKVFGSSEIIIWRSYKSWWPCCMARYGWFRNTVLSRAMRGTIYKSDGKTVQGMLYRYVPWGNSHMQCCGCHVCDGYTRSIYLSIYLTFLSLNGGVFPCLHNVCRVKAWEAFRELYKTTNQEQCLPPTISLQGVLHVYGCGALPVLRKNDSSFCFRWVSKICNE